MIECDMCCVNCFYAGDSYLQEPVEGRDSEGREVYSEDIFISSVVCKFGPKPLLVALYSATGPVDIQVEPEFHRCGQGRWWENGKWIRWHNAEDCYGDA